MKKTLLGLGLLIAGSSLVQAQKGLENIIVEKYYVSSEADSIASVGLLPKGSVTYRLYADMLPGYNFQALYGEKKGSGNRELKISTTTKFFNNEDRGATSPNGITAVQLKKNTVMLDSWFSVGSAGSGKVGVLKDSDNDGALANADNILNHADPSIGKPLTEADGIINGSANAVTFVGLTNELDVFDAESQKGNLFSTVDGSVASLGGSVGPDSTNRVLIGQFTTNGVFSFKLNIQIGTPNGGTEKYVAENPDAGEYTLQSLIGEYNPVASANQPPVISINAPDTAVAGNEIMLAANASDSDGFVASVEFFINNISIGEDTAAPFSVKWKAVEGNQVFKAIAKDNKGLTAMSSSKTIVVNKATGIFDYNESMAQFSAFPNPSNDWFQLKFNSASLKDASYQIFSINGELLLEKYLGNISPNQTELVNLSGFSAGNYIIAVKTDKGTAFKKVIKQ